MCNYLLKNSHKQHQKTTFPPKKPPNPSQNPFHIYVVVLPTSWNKQKINFRKRTQSNAPGVKKYFLRK